MRCLLLAAAAVVLGAPVAQAVQPAYCTVGPDGGPPAIRPFICARGADDGPSLNWPGRVATFRLNQAGTSDISGTQEFDVIRQGFAQWSQVAEARFDFVDGGFTSRSQVGFDFRHLDENENVVIFQQTWEHDPQVIGLTTTTFNAQTGEIFDADIELNDEQYDFTITDSDVQTDLLNTVTHEVGHFVGFDHADKTGSPIPLECAVEAAMSKATRIGEVKKRFLAASDAAGMAFVYPVGKTDVVYCNPPQAAQGTPPKIQQIGAAVGGCDAAARPSAIGSLLAATAWLRSRRRRA